jgi:myo-inositol 2-dehydrogenase/D-chiro-inositol 1-dehydrogenase
MNFFLERYMPAYRAEVAEFVAAVNGGREPSVGGLDGLRALQLADAAYASIESGRLVRL